QYPICLCNSARDLSGPRTAVGDDALDLRNARTAVRAALQTLADLDRGGPRAEFARASGNRVAADAEARAHQRPGVRALERLTGEQAGAHRGIELAAAKQGGEPGAIRQRGTPIDVDRGLQLVADEPGAAEQVSRRIAVFDPVGLRAVRYREQAPRFPRPVRHRAPDDLEARDVLALHAGPPRGV